MAVIYSKPHRYYLKRYFAAQWVQESGLVQQTPGEISLSFIRPRLLQPKHIDIMNKLLLRMLQKLFRLWVLTTPTQIVTGKPREIRMGKGKGDLAFLQAPYYAGQLSCNLATSGLFSVAFVANALRRLSYKFGCAPQLRGCSLRNARSL